MNSKVETDVGQDSTLSAHGDGDRMAAAAQREIDRRGLGGVLAAHYIAEQHAVRLGRPGTRGIPERGIDYPVHSEWLNVLVEHLRLLERTGKV